MLRIFFISFYMLRNIRALIRNRNYVNGIVLFILVCYGLQCLLQVHEYHRWEHQLDEYLQQYSEARMSAPKSYTFLAAIQVVPNSFARSEMQYLPLILEGFLFFILLCGLLSHVIQEKNVGIIRGFMGIIFMEKLIDLVMMIRDLCGMPAELIRNTQLIESFAWHIVFALLFILLSGLVILYYKQTRAAEQEVYETDGVQTISLIPTSMGRRFLNHLLDTLVIVLILSKHIYYLAERSSIDDSPYPVVLLVMAELFLYYLLTEWWFSATPGKMFTSCRVIDQHGEAPGFFKVLVRTLCRFIPFDRLSFFFQANWHDKMSETWVVGDVLPTEREIPAA